MARKYFVEEDEKDDKGIVGLWNKFMEIVAGLIVGGGILFFGCCILIKSCMDG